jgi:hypothetical protein
MTYRGGMEDSGVPDVSFLVGTGRGEGRGHYPTISDFEYREEVTFAVTPKPFLIYQQRTWAKEDGRPLHVEHGYLRVLDDNQVELVLSQPTGVVEIHTGRVEATGDGSRVVLVSTAVACSPTAKRVEAVSRSFNRRDSILEIDLSMAAVGQPLTHHLHSELKKGEG